MIYIIMKSVKKTILLSAIVLSITVSVVMAAFDPIATNAKDKGKAVSNDYNSRNILPNSSSFNYFDACSYYGMCILGDAIGDSSFYKSVFSRYKNNKPSSIPTGDVDKNSCGILPIYLFTVSKDSSLLKLGKAAADNSLEKNGYPRTAIDDTYMTGALMVQAYRATGELKYLDFFAGYLLTYMGKLQQPNGLYWHKLDSRHFWGRGNGWGAASSTELLMVLPESHAKYDSVLAGYKKQMKGLIDVQKASGIWMQLLDSKDSKNWEETSGSAMFLFAIFTGLRYGWLDSTTYLEPAKKGWTALMGYLPDAKLRNVAAGFWPSTGTANDYLNASRGQPGDSHGTAAFLWAATAAYKYFTEPVTSVNKNVDFRIISDKFNPAGTYKYFGLSGRLIGYERSMDSRKRQPPGIVIMRGVNSSRSNVTLE